MRKFLVIVAVAMLGLWWTRPAPTTLAGRIVPIETPIPTPERAWRPCCSIFIVESTWNDGDKYFTVRLIPVLEARYDVLVFRRTGVRWEYSMWWSAELVVGEQWDLIEEKKGDEIWFMVLQDGEPALIYAFHLGIWPKLA